MGNKRKGIYLNHGPLTLSYIRSQINKKNIESVMNCKTLVEKALEKIQEENPLLKWVRDELPSACNPPIKGKITRGKLKWRGISYCHYEDGNKSISFFTQRGIQISPTFEYSFYIK